MQMVISVVADQFVQELVDNLMDEGISVTEIASTGGFLSAGNTTIVIGVEKKKLDLIDAVFTRVFENKKEEDVAGAHLFAIELERGLRI